MFPTFPTSLLFSWEIEETVRNYFLCFLHFLRVFNFVRKVKKWWEIFSFVSYISYELNMFVRNYSLFYILQFFFCISDIYQLFILLFLSNFISLHASNSTFASSCSLGIRLRWRFARSAEELPVTPLKWASANLQNLNR